MTNNFDEHDEHEQGDFIEHENGLHEEGAKPGITGNLAEAWRTRPLFKFLVLLVAVFAVAVAAFSFFGGSNGNSEMAHLGKVPQMKEAPGGTVSPYMREQTDLANKERAEQAIASNGSAMPTPVGQTSDVSNMAGANGQGDPLNELRAETEILKKQVAQQQQQQAVQQQQQAQQQRPPEQFDNTLAEAMQRQMQQLLESWTPKGIKDVTVLKPEDLQAQQKAADAQAATQAANLAAQQPRKIVVNAGTVSYGQLLTEANSDVPGPIMVQIVSGPLAGARAIGSFEVAMGYEKYLVLRFSLADKKGKDYQINAIALDPDTTLGGMATEVDERYFVRVVLPAAAGFLQGLGSGVSQGESSITTNGTTTITSSANNGFKQGVYTGIGQAANTMGQFFQEQANLTKPLVRVASGTPMGIFFVTPVYEPNTDTELAIQNGAGQNGQGTSYPGTNVNFGGAPLPGSNAVPYPNYANPGAGYYNSQAANRGYYNNGYPTTTGYPGAPVSAYNPTVQGYGQQ